MAAREGVERPRIALPRPPHVLIVEARFYGDLADELAEGAIDVIRAHGGTWERVAVPGAFELPGAIAIAAGRPGAGGRTYDGYVALGCVIRGETSHYDYVCGESARGLMDLAVQRRLAIGYGVLTVDTEEQAWARARRNEQDKGGDVAYACISMIGLRHKYGEA
jgi:6,7-dimethyl-8-ribityllumazine synthase